VFIRYFNNGLPRVLVTEKTALSPERFFLPLLPFYYLPFFIFFKKQLLLKMLAILFSHTTIVA